MKKHFLILMLLALLPLSGWAQIDLSDYSVAINGTGSLIYSGGAQTVALIVKAEGASAALSATTDYDVTYYATESSATPLSLSAVKDAKTYWASAKGKGSYTGETARVSFNIAQRSMITTTIANFTAKTYTGSELTYSNTDFTGKVTVADPAITLVKGTDYDVAYTNNTNAGTATMTFTGKGNFTGTTTKDFTISTKNLPAYSATAYVMTAADSYTYNGEVQAPTFVVKDGTTELKKDKDYTVVWYTAAPDASSEAAAGTTGPIDYAEHYYAKIFGKGNYTNTPATGVIKNDVFTFAIAKKSATITIKKDSKVYDGVEVTNDNLDQTKISFRGIVPNDADAASENFINPTSHEAEVYIEFAAGTGTVQDADEYTVVAKLKAGATTSIAKNYDITWWTTAPVYYSQSEADDHNATLSGHVSSGEAVPGDYETKVGTAAAGTTLTADEAKAYNAKLEGAWSTSTVKTPGDPAITGKYEITKRDVTVTLVPVKYERGAAILNAAANADQPIGVDPKESATDTQYNVEIEKATATSTTGLIGDQTITAQLALTLLEGEYADAIEYADATSLTYTPTNVTASKNYTVNTKADGEVAKGKLIVTEEELTVYVDMLKKEYGYPLKSTDFTYYAEDKNGDEVTLKKAPTYVVYDEDNKPVADGTVLGIGTYIVKIDPSNKAELKPANYSLTDDSFEPGYLVITQKTLNIIVNDLTVNEGLEESVLGSSTTPGYASVKSFETVNNEKISYYFEFGTGVTKGGNPVSLTQAANDNPFEHGVTVNLITDDTDPNYLETNANYKFNVTDGSLTVVAATDLVMNDKDINLAAKILAAHEATVDAPTTKYNVKFSTRELTGNLWNVMVLPFDIKVADLSKEFGYAVVDILDITSATDAHFVLHLGTIPANVPFMVKVAETINLAGDATATIPVLAKKFNGQVIKYAANADENLTILENGNSCVTDAAGNKFIGTYSKTATNSTTDRILGKRPQDADNGWWPYTGTVDPLRAILRLGSAAARILIDEEDGSTTEISTITAEGKAMPVDGWYTLNGVKLQGVPTEKGIYINNGKKVVIK